MQSEVVLISKSDIDSHQFLAVTAKALGYSPAKASDQTTRRLSDFERFLSILACYENPDAINRPVGETISNSASLCAHLHFSFLYAASHDTIFESMSCTRLQHVVARGITGVQLAYVSGTLDEWKTAIIECCTLAASFHVRSLYGKVLLALEKAGVIIPLSDYKKRSSNDGSFYLEHR